MFRWKFDETLAELGGRTDFRAPHADTDVKVVLAAVAIIVKRMNLHPECVSAAWIMSNVAVESDFLSQGKADLSKSARRAL